MYGEQVGKYTTYDSIFGNAEGKAEFGYTTTCPKYPTLNQLKGAASSSKKIYIEKTMDSSESGYIGSQFEKFLTTAGEAVSNEMYFYDGFPEQ